MKKNLLSLFVLIAMLLSMVSSAAATPSLASSPDPQTNQPPVETVVARVYFTSQDDLNNLAARYDILEVNRDQGYVVIILTPERYASLQQAGYRLEVDEGKTKLLNQPHAALPGQGPDTIPGYPCYRTVEETFASMDAIVTAHPDMAQIFDIGDSWTRWHDGIPAGYDIRALRLTNSNFGVIADKPTFFLMAEIHAREYTTAETAMRYAEYLINNYNVDPDITWLLDYFRVYIVTMTNPDGRKLAEQGQYWRKNVDNDDGCTDPYSWGTDLNRNHSFKWNHGGSSPYACDETYMGPSAASEPETQAIESYILTLFPDQRGPGDNDPAPIDTTGVFVTLHSFARVVLYPWGWSTGASPNAPELRTLGRKFGYFNNYQVCQVSDPSCMYTASGTSDDYAYGTLGIAAYTWEIGTDFFESCSSFESTTYPDNLPALVYALKAARRPYQNAAGPDSINVSASPAAANPGEQVLLTSTADGTRYNGGEPTQNIVEARYSIDSPSWITGTVTYPMSASDGNFNSTTEGIQGTIDTTGLAAGRHTIFVESKNANNWGVASATFLYIIQPGVSPVIEGYVREAGTNAPLAATVTAGLFNTTTDPSTGYYSMTVVSGTYDMLVEAANFAPAHANGVVAQDYQTIQQDFLLYPICTIFSDDVENGNQGWTAQSPWAITTEASHSPTHSWTDSPGGQYGNNRNISLTSQIFDLSTNTGVTLNFWHQYVTEAGWDFGLVEYTTDGNAWNTVATYDGSQVNWTQVDIPIPALDGQANARIRFRFTSDSNTTYDGWHVDDIIITAGGPGCMAPTAPVAEFSSNSPVPQGQPVNFTNETTGSEPIVYAWDFGDGVGTSTETNPVYTYAAIGTYSVTLAATNVLGTDSISHTVTVEPAFITSVDLTQVTTGTIYIGDEVDFSADLLPDYALKPYTYTIDYGDGTVITATSSLDPLLLSHIYAAGGNYTVQIWTWNAGMPTPVTDSLDLTVTVLYKVFLPVALK